MKPILMTREGFERLKAELKEATSNLTNQNENMSEAFEGGGGSWHDNAIWEAAQNTQSALRGRVKQLKDMIHSAQIIDDMEINTEQVNIGTIVKVTGFNGSIALTSITILGPVDSRPDLGIISYEAPLAKTLLKQKVGSTVRFNNHALTIASISRWQSTN